MSPLWVLPLLVVSLGAALVARAVRNTAAAAAQLTASSAALAELGRDAATLRADAVAVAAQARNLSWRSARAEVDK